MHKIILHDMLCSKKLINDGDMSDNEQIKATVVCSEGEKNHKKGGVELCFWKLLLLRSR